MGNKILTWEARDHLLSDWQRQIKKAIGLYSEARTFDIKNAEIMDSDNLNEQIVDRVNKAREILDTLAAHNGTVFTGGSMVTWGSALTSRLSWVPFRWAVGFPIGLDGFNIVANNSGGSNDTITTLGDATDIFNWTDGHGPMVANDKVRIEGAEDSGNNGEHTVVSVSSKILTLSPQSLSTTNTNDTKLTITWSYDNSMS